MHSVSILATITFLCNKHHESWLLLSFLRKISRTLENFCLYHSEAFFCKSLSLLPNIHLGPLRWTVPSLNAFCFCSCFNLPCAVFDSTLCVFLVTVINLKLQDSSPVSTLSKNLWLIFLVYNICVIFLKEHSPRNRSFRPHKTWIHFLYHFIF